ncbi:MAG: bifunctional phosphopantothenoylcysteine decarboxylase/phosphopantothenate--cysteine ligase CoaBC [Deltaproteobacteria bacterium]|nr:bifunctional phosphopantothenoylcysteine decarboxylase/phosphopantothenate--cysteine ligase CoaBC [Deltaproteobacteria bacterium]
MLKEKKVLLGVTGGIAAYKSCELVRRLKDKGAVVKVAMTDAATRFVTPLTFQALSGNPVRTSLFSMEEEQAIGHIALADWADAIVIAPATANFIAKAASGVADDFLSTFLLASRCPVLLCPSMNSNMYDNFFYKANEETLARSARFRILEPASGELACGYTGKGRLPPVQDIVAEVEGLFRDLDFSGLNILVTAGPTREPLDDVRFLSNRSTGRMGFALARAARSRGANVTLIHGPTFLEEPTGIRNIAVKTAEEMAAQTMAEFEKCNMLIMNAAVADYKPSEKTVGKKQKAGSWNLVLERTVDILSGLKDKSKGRVVIGFAAEYKDVEERAKNKLFRKGLDAIVGNDISAEDRGFESKVNAGIMLDRFGARSELPLMSKSSMAHRILDSVRSLLEKVKQ